MCERGFSGTDWQVLARSVFRNVCVPCSKNGLKSYKLKESAAHAPGPANPAEMAHAAGTENPAEMANAAGLANPVEMANAAGTANPAEAVTQADMVSRTHKLYIRRRHEHRSGTRTCHISNCDFPSSQQWFSIPSME